MQRSLGVVAGALLVLSAFLPAQSRSLIVLPWVHPAPGFLVPWDWPQHLVGLLGALWFALPPAGIRREIPLFLRMGTVGAPLWAAVMVAALSHRGTVGGILAAATMVGLYLAAAPVFRREDEAAMARAIAVSSFVSALYFATSLLRFGGLWGHAVGLAGALALTHAAIARERAIWAHVRGRALPRAQVR